MAVFLSMQDPSIKQMAEQIANDPSFQGLTSQLQESMASLMGGAEGGAAAAAAPPPMPAMPDPANFDPTKYMQAMSGMFQNPQFMQMAEKLGQAIIQVSIVFYPPRWLCLCVQAPACMHFGPVVHHELMHAQHRLPARLVDTWAAACLERAEGITHTQLNSTFTIAPQGWQGQDNSLLSPSTIRPQIFLTISTCWKE